MNLFLRLFYQERYISKPISEFDYFSFHVNVRIITIALCLSLVNLLGENSFFGAMQIKSAKSELANRSEIFPFLFFVGESKFLQLL